MCAKCECDGAAVQPGVWFRFFYQEGDAGVYLGVDGGVGRGEWKTLLERVRVGEEGPA